MKKLSEVFKAAQPYLKERVFLCSTLDAALDDDKISYPEYRKALAHITWLLEGHFTVVGWLINKGNVDAHKLNEPGASKQYRVRWIAHIIQTLEEQGK